ncbi:methylated-DNA--[protein]-cysteine S-methyltransferase [Lysinibacillus sp. NPDC093712]|uniref:methylated-DNA--[protein]-cysteine S-methyltransferase n=1 Tax=Lysinibacillus sp. NPDC093712 TaxID=3390579 RepID=UPI003CFCCAB9
MTKYKVDYNSPIGILEIIGSDEAVCSIMFSERQQIINIQKDTTPKILLDCLMQLDEYFQGQRFTFTFPYSVEGTSFQKRVWQALTNIRYAEIGTYKTIAMSIGNEKAIRAVGNANGKNKLSIVIPCHRIIGSNGTLTGYAGGLWRKEWLLQHEKSFHKGNLL